MQKVKIDVPFIYNSTFLIQIYYYKNNHMYMLID